VIKPAFISVDVEASGPIPGEYSMLSLGACEIANMKNTFYSEIQPLNENRMEEAMEVHGLSLDKLKKEGLSPCEATRKFADWIKWISNGKDPIFVAFNLGFDWSFVNYYFIKFTGHNPFGASGIDAESVWFGKFGGQWSDVSMTKIKRALELDIPHTHNAGDDAEEQAVIFERIIQSR
jgi:DNA polymerase III epsilon subunit-like protein